MKYISYQGKRYEVRDNRFNLRNLKIRRISEIKGLGMLGRLERLDLRGNSVYEKEIVISGTERKVKLLHVEELVEYCRKRSK